MGESCAVIYPFKSEETGPTNWFVDGQPCRLKPMAFFDLAMGTGVVLLLLQTALVIYWAGYHAVWFFRRKF